MHHCVHVKPTVKSFPNGSSSTYVNFIAKANGAMTVEEDYGRLQVLKIHSGVDTHAPSFTVYDSGGDAELLTQIPGDHLHRVLLSVDVESVDANDILVVTGEFQAETKGELDNSLLGSQLLLTSSPSEAEDGTELGENNVFNVTLESKRGVPIKIATHGFSSGTTDHYVNLAVWAEGGFNVDQDYGRLQVLKIRP
jgi:hypothetical protein